MLYGIVISTLSFMIFVIAHVSIFHRIHPKRRFRTIATVALLSLVLYSALFSVCLRVEIFSIFSSIIPEVIVDALNGLFVYFFLLFFYFHLIIVFDSSVTTRIMIEIDRSPDRRLTVDQVKSRYSLEDKFERELADMEHVGRIVKDGEFYKNTTKGSFHAKVVGFLRDYLNIGGHQ